MKDNHKRYCVYKNTFCEAKFLSIKIPLNFHPKVQLFICKNIHIFF